MAQLTLTGEWGGDAVAMFARMIQGLEDKKPMLEKIAEVMREDALRQFQSGGIPAWKPLSPRTIAAKRSAGYPRLGRGGKPPSKMMQGGKFGPENILERTGALLSSWTDESDPNNIEDIGEDSVSIGSSLAYAAVHQFGARILVNGRSIDIPQRAITITDQMLDKAAEAVTTTLMEES